MGVQNQPLATPIPREKGGSWFCCQKGQNPELLEMFNEGLKKEAIRVNTIKLSALT